MRWYCKYGVSYRELAEMMNERGICASHTTIYRWTQKYALKIEQKLRWFWKPGHSSSWQIDETYIKVKGRWVYLYRAITKEGETVNIYLSQTRHAKGAQIFLGKALRSIKPYLHPESLNADKDRAYAPALSAMKKEGVCRQNIQHRQVKYLNNRIESDHGKLKRMVKPTRGFQSMMTAFATFKGFEVMRMFRKKQMNVWLRNHGIIGEVRRIERQFSF